MYNTRQLEKSGEVSYKEIGDLIGLDNEIDYLEESVEKGLVAYEFKWNPAKAANAKCPKAFAAAYPQARWFCISRENYVEFVTGLI